MAEKSDDGPLPETWNNTGARAFYLIGNAAGRAPDLAAICQVCLKVTPFSGRRIPARRRIHEVDRMSCQAREVWHGVMADLLQEYLAELSKLELLGAEAERELWRAFKAEGDRESRRRLLEAYQPLVLKIALRLATDEALCAELIQEGTLGLIEAVEGFEPRREVRFSTYSQHRIRGRMLDYLRRNNRFATLALELGHWEEEMDEFLGMIRDESVDVEAEVNRRALRDLLGRAMDRLSARERQIIEGVYLEDRTPQEVAERLGISASYLYKTQKRALRRLRGLLARNRGELGLPG